MLAITVTVLDADLDVGRQGRRPQHQKESRERPFGQLEPAPRRIRIRAREPTPLYGQAIEPDPAVDLDGQQQHDVQRPEVFAPDPVGGFERSDVVRAGKHRVQVHGRQEEQGEAGDHLPEPERGVFVLQHPHVATEGAVLTVVDRKFAHREQGVRDDQRDDAGDHARDDHRIGPAEEEIALEEFGDHPHGVLAEQDRRDESHVYPHEKRKHETGGALRQVKSRRPMAAPRGVGQTNTGNHRAAVFHREVPLPACSSLISGRCASGWRGHAHGARVVATGRSETIAQPVGLC